MTDKSVNIDWRKNNHYNNIDILLQNIDYRSDIIIYNLTSEELGDIQSDNISKIICVSDKSVNTLKKRNN